MTTMQIALLAAGFLLIASLYSTVGHGGASGYLMVMGLAGWLGPEVMKPTALILNLVVAGTGVLRFYRAGGFRWRTLWPFVVTSVPCAFLGGAAQLDPAVYTRLVAVVLVFAAFCVALRNPARGSPEPAKSVPLPGGLLWGAAIGLLSGLVGVGGGIFLSPLLLLAGWATARQTAGISAAFIVLNSASGLVGFIARHHTLPVEPAAMAIFSCAVLLGGFVGSGIGSRRLGHISLRRALAVVLLVAAIKMMLVGDSSGRMKPANGTGAPAANVHMTFPDGDMMKAHAPPPRYRPR
ncbi:MAG: sulfite exporter TauE/SafE family protein [Planctomycetes bacterium]|nr:sulfite exporter TauE/SafE family protein [Planctomycetota bacterium]